jgi:hypothetical protein
MLLALLLAPLAAQRRVVGEVARCLLDLACDLVLDAHHGLFLDRPSLPDVPDCGWAKRRLKEPSCELPEAD